MISIYILYSPDREKAIRIMLSFLKEMSFFDQCQKTLVVDGKSNIILDDFEVIQLPRVTNEFNWSYAWSAGVLTAKYPIVWYLDSDRLLPKNYIQLLKNTVREDKFVFTSNHYLMESELDLETCKDFVYRTSREGMLLEDKFIGKIKFDPRYGEPINFPGKNVMSGNTAFLRSTFEKLGGVDVWYEGHGAFADTDFHIQSAVAGCQFIDLKVPELHYFHEKKNNDQKVDDETLKKMSLDNYLYYCVKWKIPIDYPLKIASNIQIKDPLKYVRRRIKEIKGEL